MKKVISALTVAAMCASMSASVMPAFAINAADAEFYLKAAKADKGTISADGATITFASAADAKGAKITIQEFIKADTAPPLMSSTSLTRTLSSSCGVTPITGAGRTPMTALIP